MYRLFIFPTLILAILCSSCSKQIKGKILDNFGNPVQDVAVTIQNSQHESKTNSNGEYSIDYAAGEIVLNFNKEGYNPSGEVLYIAEKQDYPATDVRITKLPNQAGIYIAGGELSDYVQLTSQTTVTSKLIDNDRKRYRRPLEFFNANTDSTTVIKLSSLDDVRIYTYKIKKHLFGKVGENRKIAELGTAMYYKYLLVNEPIKLKEYSSNKGLKLYFITPKYGVDYVFVLEEGFNKIDNLNTKHYVFRFEK